MAPRKKIVKRILELRGQLWPDVQDDQLWLRKKQDGFTTIPRTMPLILGIMDDLTGGQPVSGVYFELWCRAFDECMVTLGKPREMAFHSGFSGQRAETAWRSRLRKLAELGFIGLKPGPSGPESYALIYNPHKIITQLKARKEPGLSEAKFNALLERAGEIGASDMEAPPAPPAPRPKASTSFARDLDDKVPF